MGICTSRPNEPLFGRNFLKGIAIFFLCFSLLFPLIIALNTNGQAPSLQASPIIERSVPQNQSYPLGITMDSKGNVWFAEASNRSIVEYIVSNQTFHAYKLPTNASGLTMIWFMFFDNNGYLWFADQNQPLLWSFNPLDGRFANFTTGNELVRPFALAYDSAANGVWFTSTYTNQIGHFILTGDGQATLEGLVTLPSIGSVNSGPSGIYLGPEGRLYISQSFTASIAEYSIPTQSFVHEWQLPSGTQPVGVYADSARNLVWFTDHGASLFGYVNETNSKVQEFATSLFHYKQSDGQRVSSITLPYWISESSAGIVWFDEHYSNRIARFDPTTNTLTEFQVPTISSEPLRFYMDNLNNNLWFTEFTGNKIAFLSMDSSTPSGSFLENESATLAGSAINLIANAPSSEFNSTSFSGTMTTIGDVSSNISISVSGITSTASKITIERGQNLIQGNYSLTVCKDQTKPSVNQCSVLFLSVPSQSGLQSTGAIWIYLVAAVIIISTALFSIFIIRRWRF